MNSDAKLRNPDVYDHQGILAVAALFEESFSIDWIVDLTKRRASEIISAVEEGIKRGWMEKTDPCIFCFVDMNMRQGLQNQLTSEEKNLLKREIVDLLSTELPDDRTTARTLAPYLIETSNDLKKCRWLERAGDLYLEDYNHRKALECYTKVLNDISDQYGEETDRFFIQAALKYLRISTAIHDTTKVLSVINEAMMRAKAWDIKSAQALLEMHLAKNEWLCSRYKSAIRHFEEGWSMTKEINDPKLLRSGTTFRCFFLYWQGRYQEAIQSYEAFLPEVDKLPNTNFPLLAALTLGRCYAYNGQVTQGLGMLDALRTHCMEKGNELHTVIAEFCIGSIMLIIDRVDDALSFLESSMGKAERGQNDWAQIMGRLALAYGYYLKGKNKQCLSQLRQFLKQRGQVRVTVQPNPFLMHLCWAMEEKKLPRIAGLSIEREVNRMIRGINIFMKGVAYRYKAFLQMQKGLPQGTIIKSLRLSLKWLEESGHQIELARTQLELARQNMLIGKKKTAKSLTKRASIILSSFNESLVPDDLRSLIRDRPSQENLLREILRLGQEAVTFKDNNDLIQHILFTLNRVIGAERGAMLLIDKKKNRSTFHLAASKNLIPEQIDHPDFAGSRKVIEEVVESRKGYISGRHSEEIQEFTTGEVIRSLICAPMIFQNKVIGVLYHDNRLLSQAFKDSDLELLAYFSALATFAISNSKAYEEVRGLNQRLKEENLYYEEQHLQKTNFDDIVGESPAIMEVLNKIYQVAGTDSTVMIRGETGVGKELIARAIHRHSMRKDKAFITVNCSALPDTLIPSELFGHEKGAFTGAIGRRIGRFELADGGTLFLDEIGDISLEVQVRLLRVLQSKEFERIGGTKTLRSDFRLVVATNRDLEQAINTQQFRADLYYRLNVFPIYVPPLRNRKEDIPLLAQHFLTFHGREKGKTFKAIREEETDKLMAYDWPGNVRELENVIERGVILQQGIHFRVPKLDEMHSELPYPKGGGPSLKENERRHILWALRKTGWKVRGPGGAAELIDIHPSTLAFRMKKLDIVRPKTVRKKRGLLQPVNRLLPESDLSTKY